MLLTPVKLIGAFFATIALFAGLSVWFVAGMVQDAWAQTHRKTASGTPIGVPLGDALIPVGVAALVCVALHGVGWIARTSMARREQSIGMSASFWKVLYYAAYMVGFAGGAAIFLTAPK